MSKKIKIALIVLAILVILAILIFNMFYDTELLKDKVGSNIKTNSNTLENTSSDIYEEIKKKNQEAEKNRPSISEEEKEQARKLKNQAEKEMSEIAQNIVKSNT